MDSGKAVTQNMIGRQGGNVVDAGVEAQIYRALQSRKPQRQAERGERGEAARGPSQLAGRRSKTKPCQGDQRSSLAAVASPVPAVSLGAVK
jgi:hypothetical protein